MSIASRSPARQIARHVYQTSRLGPKQAHPLLATARIINAVASRHGVRFEGWDETAGSLSWRVPRGLRNGNRVAIQAGNQVLIKAAIVRDDGAERIVVGLREEIIDLPVSDGGTRGSLSGFNWRRAFALLPHPGKMFLQLDNDLATLEPRLDAALRELLGFDPDRAIPDVLAAEGVEQGISADDQLLQAAAGRSVIEPPVDGGVSPVPVPVQGTPADRTRFPLNAERWKAFLDALDAPPRDLSRLERLFKEPSVIERGLPE